VLFSYIVSGTCGRIDPVVGESNCRRPLRCSTCR